MIFLLAKLYYAAVKWNAKEKHVDKLVKVTRILKSTNRPYKERYEISNGPNYMMIYK